MAGDWIKVEKGAGTKPETLKFARMLGISRREAFGLLVEFWEWLDGNCVDGVVDGVVDADVDAVLQCPGFSALLRLVGWAKFDEAEQKMTIVNFERHNGKTAKNRALKSERQANWRLTCTNENVDGRASTREEKRREETKDQKLLSGKPDDAPKNGHERPQGENDAKAIRLRALRADAVAIIGFLNEKTGRAYKPDGPNVDMVVALLKAGATPAEVRQVIAKKAREWKGDAEMDQYVRPKTLFNRTNFANYAGELVTTPDDEGAGQ